MPLTPEFVADCPYGPGGLLIDDICEIDREAGRVVATLPAHEELPLTREQRAHPLRHPRHVSGGLMVHLTGMMGFVHAYHVLDLRHADGWIGYGGRIYDARFLALGVMGEKMRLACTATRTRVGRERAFVRYDFEFTQGETVVYRSDQSAMWLKIEDGPEGTPAATPGDLGAAS